MSWISEHRTDITFLISLTAAIALLVVGLVTSDTPTILLGAGALGIPGTASVVRTSDEKT
jgi:hypothetical protein